MKIHPDFKDLLAAFNAQKVEFLIIANKRASGRKKDLADIEALGAE